MSAYQQALKLAANTYQQKIELFPQMFPLPEEMHIGVWQSYAQAAEKEDAFQVLSERLPQFWFPVKKGVSETDDYRAALRLGVARDRLPGATGLRLARAGELTLRVYTGPVCSVPVLYPRGKNDFLTLLRALAMRHEPAEVAEAVGAVMISGFNNWDRLHALRRSFEERQPRECSWEEEFRCIRQCKELYQDRILILSDRPYAGLSAGQMGMSEDAWLKISLKLRLEHECMHVLTKRLFKPAAKSISILDELIADSLAIIRVAGYFKPDWLLSFWGLKQFSSSSKVSPPSYPGGLLKHYAAGVQTEVFNYLSGWILAAAAKIEQLNSQLGSDLSGQLLLINHLAQYDLNELT